MNPNKLEFINRMRRLAGQFIQASDTFTNLMNEQTYAQYDFLDGDFSDITAAQFDNFIATLAGLLGQLTPEQKQAIYAVKGSGALPLPAPIVSPPLPQS